MHLQVANKVYRKNWGPLLACRSIEHLVPMEVDGAARLWTMSPPCQPFCQQGLKRDDADARSKSFLHLLGLLGKIQLPPDYIFLENVPLFEGSRCHSILLDTLSACGYEVCEASLSPECVGIPNTRNRYFLMATRMGSFSSRRLDLPATTVRPLGDFLLRANEVAETPMGSLVIPRSTLEKFHRMKFDVVTPSSQLTTTLTKGYGKQVGKSGPVLDLRSWEAWLASGHVCNELASGRFRTVRPEERLRLLSPRELLRLHGYPDSFTFPEEVSHRQAMALIGNSVTVPLVARLLGELLP